jgi:hypothetical protein
MAFLYHPLTSNPLTYNAPTTVSSLPTPQKAGGLWASIHGPIIQTPTVIPPAPCGSQCSCTPAGPTNVISSVATGSDDGTARADARGTVCVPSRVIKKAGLKPFGSVAVYASISDRSVTIVGTGGTPPATHACRRSYTVDKASNVRVTRHLFKTAGLPYGAKGQKYRVKVSNGTVVIRA